MDHFGLKIPFKKLYEDAIIPTHGTSFFDAGLDFYAQEDVTVPARSHAIIGTGVAWDGMTMGTEYEHFFIMLKSRSGLAFKQSIEASNAGVIDSAYSGEIKGKLYNHTDEDFAIKKGDKFIQGVVISQPFFQPIEVFEITKTDRGDNGFGSTGGHDSLKGEKA